MSYAEPRFITENHVMPLTTGLVQVTLSPYQPSGPVAGSENRTSVWSTSSIRNVVLPKTVSDCLGIYPVVEQLPLLRKIGYANASA